LELFAGQRVEANSVPEGKADGQSMQNKFGEKLAAAVALR
jgi:hypothetical protein